MNKFWTGNLDLNQKIHIIGGGISGLLAAYAFKKNNIDFHLYESSLRLGGKIGSEKSEYGVVEWGPNAIVSSDIVLKFLLELNLRPIPTTPRLKKCIFRDNKIQAFPKMISGREKMKIIASLLRTPPPHSEASVHDYFAPLLGDQVCDEILSPILRGIYATSARNILAKSLFDSANRSYISLLLNKIRTKRVRSISLKGGMQELVDALTYRLEGKYTLNQRVELMPNTLICTDPMNAAQLLGSVSTEVSNELSSFKQSPIYSTTYFLEKPLPELRQSFGLLFNEKDSPELMGILANSNIFSLRKWKKPSYTFITNKKMDLTKDSFVKKVLPNFKSDNILLEFNYSYPYGLPRYDQTQSEGVLKLERFLKPEPYALWGNYLKGISLRKLIELTSR